MQISKPQLNPLANLMTGIINIDHKENISNISSKILNARDRGWITKFLNNAPWNVKGFDHLRIKKVLVSAKLKAKQFAFIALFHHNLLQISTLYP